MEDDRLKRVYFETSALNFFMSTRNIQDAIATKAHQNLKGKGFYISPVVLWEIILTSNEIQREKIIYFAQHLFESDLLPSPEEIIIHFLESGCPKIEKKYPLVSKGQFSKPWRDMCAIKEKTLIYDPALIASKVAILKSVSQVFRKFIKHDSLDISISPGIIDLQISIQSILDRFSLVPAVYHNNTREIQYIRLVVFYILLVLCAGISIEGHLIEEFWQQKGIPNIRKRIDYVFENYPQLVLHGPFHPIAYMTYLQSKERFSRGVFFDSLHSVYSVYADEFLTADEHFCMFRENLIANFHYTSNIWHFNELQITSAARNNLPLDSFLLQKIPRK